MLLSRKELGCLLSLAYSGSSQLRSGFSSLPQQSDGKPRAVSDPAQIASYNSLMVRVWSNNVAVGTIPSILSIPFYQESVRAIAQLSVTCPWGALFGMTLLPITTLHALALLTWRQSTVGRRVILVGAAGTMLPLFAVIPGFQLRSDLKKI